MSESVTEHIAIGRRHWAIAEGCIPAGSHGEAPEMASHEAACLLDATNEDARVEFMIYHTAREPVGPCRITVPDRRTKHVRFNDLADPEPIPKGTPSASTFTSNVPIVVRHARLDSRQSANALLGTIAYSGGA